MNYKKRRPISTRNRCMCKFWKFWGNSYSAKHISVQRSIEKMRQGVQESER